MSDLHADFMPQMFFHLMSTEYTFVRISGLQVRLIIASNSPVLFKALWWCNKSLYLENGLRSAVFEFCLTVSSSNMYPLSFFLAVSVCLSLILALMKWCGSFPTSVTATSTPSDHHHPLSPVSAILPSVQPSIHLSIRCETE